MPSPRPGPTAEAGAGAARPSPPARRSGPVGPGGEAGRRWLAVLLVPAAAACAKEEPPPGAAPDQTPPSVREIRPADGSVVPDFDGALTFRFDEPVEAPRGLARRIEASPVGQYEVAFGFDRIQVRPAEGWLPGAVYRFRLPVAVSDLLDNEREGPLEVTFSTGPAITDTRLTGRIFDRVTREAREGARVLFLAAEGDSIPYGAVADTGGRFELRSLPPDTYRTYAFRDLNGNRTLERRLEPWDSATVRLPDSTATADVRLSVLEPDSTPPRLAVAEAVDSVVVELGFDDHMDPAQTFEPDSVTVTGEDGEAVAVAAAGLTRASIGREPEEAADGDRDRGARRDTAAPADTAAARDTFPDADSLAAPVGREDTAVAAAPADTAAPSDTLPLPSRTVLVRTARPLEDSVRYRVRARGFRNLQGLVGGGDTSFVYTRPPDTAAADTAPPDTAVSDTAAGPDTAARDTARADTSAGGEPAPRDTAAAPDTARRAPAAGGGVPGPDRLPPPVDGAERWARAARPHPRAGEP